MSPNDVAAVGRGTATNALTVHRDSSRELEPASLNEVKELAVIAFKAGWFGLKSADDAIVRICTGRELGLTAFQSLRTIHVINGRPTLPAALKIALCQRSPECEYFRMLESTPTQSTWETKRKNSDPVKVSFSMEDAKLAGLLTKDVWKQYPKNMLRWRAAAALADFVYPECLMGLSTPEEMAHAVVDAGDVVTVSPDGEVLDIKYAKPTRPANPSIPQSADYSLPVPAVLSAPSATLPTSDNPTYGTAVVAYLEEIAAAKGSGEMKDIRSRYMALNVSTEERLLLDKTWTNQWNELKKAADARKAQGQ